MINIKSSFLILLTVLFFQQSLHAQVTIFGGAQNTSANYQISNAKQSTKEKLGYMGGIGLTSSIEGPLYFSPMLYYSQKGYEVTFNPAAHLPDSTLAKNNNTTINTIVLAPLFQFNFSKSKSHLFFRFGPAVDFALNGKEAFDSTNNKHYERDMTFDFANYSAVTISGNLHLGYQDKSGFTLFAYYEHGLTSLNNADGGPSILHRIYGAAIGWKFGKKK